MDQSEVFVQSDAIRDVVFPLFIVSENEGHIKVESFAGTGFLVGQRGMALTAAHIVRNVAGRPAVAGFVGRLGNWHAFHVTAMESHPSEDISVIQIENPSHRSWNSWMRPSMAWEGSSCSYALWGYPEDVYHEVIVDGVAIGRPDLIFSQGHIRRRISNIPLDAVRGINFYELSTVAGPGCSGSPVIKWPPNTLLSTIPNPPWDVIGVYSGERLRETGDISVGYAVRMDAIQDWVPSLLGHTLDKELEG